MKKIDLIKSQISNMYYKENKSLSKIAEYFNVSFCCVCNNFIRYGLKRRSLTETNKIRTYPNKYKITKKLLFDYYIKSHLSCEKISKILKCSSGTVIFYLKKFNIPCHRLDYSSPFLGKHHSNQAKKALSKSHKGFLPFSTKRFKYNDLLMRSSWEVAYARWLDKQEIKWLYESKTFDLGTTTYTPDFYLPESDIYIEIKGYWRYKSKKKFRVFKKLYKRINIVVLYKSELLRMGAL